ncbi:MAG: fused response regulator/phosphatase [Methylococcales bacterium]|nr:fused response regulator/phosphatase [Methylococcales bacterium]
MKKALVVDDNKINRHLLNVLLKRNGYEVFEAENGLQAVEKFVEHQPFIVFMDLMMPVMDGIESCKRIKALCEETSFVPIIFVTAVSDDVKLSECIDSGGDDFIVKPVDLRILLARIKSVERLSVLYSRYHAMVASTQRDQEVAKMVFNQAILADSHNCGEIKTLLKSAEMFSGDIFLSAMSPSGELHVMLADFTGHGLKAAIGALPASNVFKAMIAKGFTGDKILAEMNNKLKQILPIGMFMAVQYVVIRKELDYALVCICGMPDVIIKNTSKIKQRINSVIYPLSVTANINYKPLFEKVPISTGDSIIMFSDGVIEATNPQKELFGQPRLEALIESDTHHNVTVDIKNALIQFCEGGKTEDDISLAEIICADGLFVQAEKTVTATQEKAKVIEIRTNDQWAWHYQLTLAGTELVNQDPIPLLITQLKNMEKKLEDHLQPLYTILTELYVNALDHGILQLNSTLKSTPEGFGDYFNEREKRLETLKTGNISFSLKGFRKDKQLKIKITIIDSGDGFDISKVLNKPRLTEELVLYGRGIILVDDLCQSLVYSEPGNKVEVVYTWNEEN